MNHKLRGPETQRFWVDVLSGSMWSNALAFQVNLRSVPDGLIACGGRIKQDQEAQLAMASNVMHAVQVRLLLPIIAFVFAWST